MRPFRSSSIALLTALLFGPAFAKPIVAAQGTPTPVYRAATQCANGHPLELTLPEFFERIATTKPAVLCAFRNKNGGFPTLNVVIQPRLNLLRTPSLHERQEQIVESYRAVGLHAATLSDSSEGQVRGHGVVQARVDFTTGGGPMMARIVIIDLHDETYTLTALDRADRSQLGYELLKQISAALTIEGEPVSNKGRHITRWGWATGLMGIVLALLVALAVSRGRMKGRGKRAC